MNNKVTLIFCILFSFILNSQFATADYGRYIGAVKPPKDMSTGNGFMDKNNVWIREDDNFTFYQNSREGYIRNISLSIIPPEGETLETFGYIVTKDAADGFLYFITIEDYFLKVNATTGQVVQNKQFQENIAFEKGGTPHFVYINGTIYVSSGTKDNHILVTYNSNLEKIAKVTIDEGAIPGYVYPYIAYDGTGIWFAGYREKGRRQIDEEEAQFFRFNITTGKPDRVIDVEPNPFVKDMYYYNGNLFVLSREEEVRNIWVIDTSLAYVTTELEETEFNNSIFLLIPSLIIMSIVKKV